MDKSGKMSYGGRGITVGNFRSPNRSQVVQASVYHIKGCGTYAHFQLCEIGKRDGYEVISFVVFQDLSKRYCLEANERFSKKVLLDKANDLETIKAKLNQFTQQFNLGEGWE